MMFRNFEHDPAPIQEKRREKCARAISAACLFVFTGCATPSTEHFGPQVEFALGKHRYSIPENYFRHRVPPPSNRRAELALKWPELSPAAYPEPGVAQTMLWAVEVGVTLVPLDEVEPETAARIRANGLKHDGRGEVVDFGSRVKGSDVHGLAAYYTDFEKLRSEASRKGQNVGVVTKPYHAYNNDWFIKYRVKDDLPDTVIDCTPHVLIDGLSISGSRLIRQGENANTDLLTTCTHTFEIPEVQLLVYIHYSRVFLGEWTVLENKIRQLLAPLPRK